MLIVVFVYVCVSVLAATVCCYSHRSLALMGAEPGQILLTIVVRELNKNVHVDVRDRDDKKCGWAGATCRLKNDFWPYDVESVLKRMPL